MKRITRIGILFVVVLAGLLLALNYGIGAMVKTAVVQGGPPLLGVPVTLEKAHFRLLQGVVRLNGFVLGNPEGFKTDHAIAVDEVIVEFDVKSLFSDTFVIKRVYVKAPEIVYEMGLGKSNIGKILEKMEGSDEAKPEAEKKPEGVKPGKKVIIEDFLIEGARVRLSASLAMGAAVPIPLPDIHLKDIGKDEGRKGASPAEVIAKVFGAIVSSTTQVVTSSVNLIKSGGGKAVEGVKNLFSFGDSKAATNEAGKAAKAEGL